MIGLNYSKPACITVAIFSAILTFLYIRFNHLIRLQEDNEQQRKTKLR